MQKQYSGACKCPEPSIIYSIGRDCWAKNKDVPLEAWFSGQEQKAGIEQHAANFHFNTPTIQNNIWQAYKQFHQLKADPDHRDMWIARIIHAQAQSKGTTTKSLWKQHHLAEHACKMAQLVCVAFQPSNWSGALMMVIGPTIDGRQEFHMRYLLESLPWRSRLSFLTS